MQTPILDNLLKQNLSGLPVKDFLQKVTDEHPYFAPAHFFMLQLLQQAQEEHTAQAAKTALLFNNPHWLQFQLQQGQQTDITKEAPVVFMHNNDKPSADVVVEEAAVVADKDELATIEKIAPAIVETNNDVIVEAKAAESNEAIESPDSLNETVQEPEIKIDLAASIKNAENENAPAFEPMHLVDYFASQGIKLSDEVQTADKLGKQLKSFTEWLKTMKKVHTAEAAVSGSEIAVQALAEKSNTENEVITEAMADVLAQQGKAHKAIEMYEKLSLLNPAKSAFFASQIEKLKGE